jgi:fucose 4-O-acetylase-like acetyltransferase
LLNEIPKQGYENRKEIIVRSKQIDVLKGLAIILVVLYHAICWTDPNFGSNKLLNVLQPFLMPTFFAISGYVLFKSRITNYKAWILDKAKYLLIPHLALDLFLFAASYTKAATGASQINSYGLGQWMYKSLWRNEGEWFCWVLFFVLLFMLIIYFIDKHRDTQSFWMFMIVTLLIIEFAPLPPGILRLVEIQWYIPFALIGYLVAKYNSLNKIWYLMLFGVVFLFPAQVISNWNGGWVTQPMLDLYHWALIGQYSIWPTRFLQAICGMCTIVLLTKWISRYNWSTPFSIFGRYSFFIYLMHSVILLAFSLGNNLPQQLMMWILSLLGSLALAIVLSRIPQFNRWVPRIYGGKLYSTQS